MSTKIRIPKQLDPSQFKRSCTSLQNLASKTSQSNPIYLVLNTKEPPEEHPTIPVELPNSPNPKAVLLLSDHTKDDLFKVDSIIGADKPVEVEYIKTWPEKGRKFDIIYYDNRISNTKVRKTVGSKGIITPVLLDKAIEKRVRKLRNCAWITYSKGGRYVVRIGDGKYLKRNQIMANVAKLLATMTEIVGEWENITNLGLKTNSSALLPLYSPLENDELDDERE